MTTDVQHTDVAAYALGLLEETDRRAFEAHLAGCPLCAAELGDFTGMAEIFDDVPSVEPRPDPPDGGELVALLRHRELTERRRRRRMTLLGAAAGVALLAGGAVAGGLAAHDRPAHTARDQAAHPTATPGHGVGDVFRDGEKVAAVDAGTGVTGAVAMRSKGWGTDVGIELSRVKGPLVCRLVAVSTTGERRTVSEWSVPPKGYGLPGSPMRTLQVHGGTALGRADLARFDVQVEGSGRTLLSIPV